MGDVSATSRSTAWARRKGRPEAGVTAAAGRRLSPAAGRRRIAWSAAIPRDRKKSKGTSVVLRVEAEPIPPSGARRPKPGGVKLRHSLGDRCRVGHLHPQCSDMQVSLSLPFFLCVCFLLLFFSSLPVSPAALAETHTTQNSNQNEATRGLMSTLAAQREQSRRRSERADTLECCRAARPEKPTPWQPATLASCEAEWFKRGSGGTAPCLLYLRHGRA